MQEVAGEPFRVDGVSGASATRQAVGVVPLGVETQLPRTPLSVGPGGDQREEARSP